MKFKFDDRVEVNQGFYQGQKGSVRNFSRRSFSKKFNVIVNMDHGALGGTFDTYCTWKEEHLSPTKSPAPKSAK